MNPVPGKLQRALHQDLAAGVVLDIQNGRAFCFRHVRSSVPACRFTALVQGGQDALQQLFIHGGALLQQGRDLPA